MCWLFVSTKLGNGLAGVNRALDISDTKSGKVHVLMGQGEITFGPVLQALKEKYDGALVIEGWHPQDERGMVERSTAFLGKQLAEI